MRLKKQSAKRKPTGWERIFAGYTFARGLVSIISQVLTKQRVKNNNNITTTKDNPFKNWALAQSEEGVLKRRNKNS